MKVETKTEAKAEAGQRDEARSRRKAVPQGAAPCFLFAAAMEAVEFPGLGLALADVRA